MAEASQARRRETGGAEDTGRRQTEAYRRGHLRAWYFAVAALWGFVAGSGGVLAGLSVVGQPIAVGPGVVGILGAASLGAVLGGVVLSRAYREAVRRGRF